MVAPGYNQAWLGSMNIGTNVALFLSAYLVWIVTITSAHIRITIAKALLDFAFCHAFYNRANRIDVPPLSNIKNEHSNADQQ